MFDAMVMIFSSLFIMYVSTNWVHLHSLFLVVIAFSLSVFCALPESPKYLAQREAFDDAISAYNTIARFNRTRQLDRVFERLRGQKRRDRRAFKWWVSDAKRRQRMELEAAGAPGDFEVVKEESEEYVSSEEEES